VTTLLQDIPGALAAKLQALALGYAVAWEGTGYTPVIGTAFLATKNLPSATNPISIGAAGTVRYSGIYQISVYTPTGKGVGLADSIASAIADGYSRALVSQNGHAVQCGIPHAAPAIVQGDWIHKPVSIPYYLTI